MKPLRCLAVVACLCSGCDQSRAVVGDAVIGDALIGDALSLDSMKVLEEGAPQVPPEPKLDWELFFVGDDDDYATAVAVDPNGVYMAGVFQGVLDVDAHTTLKSAGSYDIYVVALTAAGELRWARRLGGPDADRATDLIVDSVGNLYITGWFQQTVTTDKGSLTSSGDKDQLVASWDAKGNLRWAVGLGGPEQDEGRRLAWNKNALHATGCLNQPGATNKGELVVTQLGDGGKQGWSRAISDGAQAGTFDVAVDGAGTVYLGGSCGGSIDFKEGPNSVKPADVFIGALSATGGGLWSRGFTSNYMYSSAFALMPDGTLMLVGRTGSPVDFGGGPLDGMYMASFSAAGSHLWSKSFKPTPGSEAIPITFSPIAGIDAGTDGVVYLVSQKFDVAAFRDGDLLWSTPLAPPGARPSYGYDIAVGPGGAVYAAGATTGGDGNYNTRLIRYVAQ